MQHIIRKFNCSILKLNLFKVDSLAQSAWSRRLAIENPRLNVLEGQFSWGMPLSRIEDTEKDLCYKHVVESVSLHTQVSNVSLILSVLRQQETRLFHRKPLLTERRFNELHLFPVANANRITVLIYKDFYIQLTSRGPLFKSKQHFKTLTKLGLHKAVQVFC